MVKQFLKFLVFITIFALPLTGNAFSGQVYMRDSVYQGNSLEVRIPKEDYTAASGIFMNENVNFYNANEPARPDEPISRGAFLKTVLNNMEELPELTQENIYNDLNEDNEYYNEILLATQMSIVNGSYVIRDSSCSFEIKDTWQKIQGYIDASPADAGCVSVRPYDLISRAEAAKILYNAFDFTTQNNSYPNFPDLDSSHPLYAFMLECYRAQIFKGYDDGTLKPNNPINYFETEIILKRVLGTEEINFDKSNNYFRGFVGIDRRWNAGAYYLDLTFTKDGQTGEYSQKVDVVKSDFKTNYFTISQSNMNMTTSGQSDKDWAKIYEVIKTSEPKRLFEGQFIVPAEGHITLGYGDILYINRIYSGSHFGIDYANPTGTEVHASNSGKVIMAEYTDFFGNIVIIDHGENIFSMYLHLNELKCQKDQSVNQNDLIGLMGMTGFSTGPHLHFSVIVGDNFVNPQQFYEMTF